MRLIYTGHDYQFQSNIKTGFPSSRYKVVLVYHRSGVQMNQDTAIMSYWRTGVTVCWRTGFVCCHIIPEYLRKRGEKRTTAFRFYG